MPAVVEHAVDAVGRQQQQLAAARAPARRRGPRSAPARRRRWSARCASDDAAAAADRRRGSCASIDAIHESSCVSWRSAPPREQIEPAVADVRDRQAPARDPRRDDRRPHAGVVVRVDRRFADLHVGEVDGGAQQVAVRRQRGIDVAEAATSGVRRVWCAHDSRRPHRPPGARRPRRRCGRPCRRRSRRARAPRQSRNSLRWSAGRGPCRLVRKLVAAHPCWSRVMYRRGYRSRCRRAERAPLPAYLSSADEVERGGFELQRLQLGALRAPGMGKCRNIRARCRRRRRSTRCCSACRRRR